MSPTHSDDPARLVIIAQFTIRNKGQLHSEQTDGHYSSTICSNGAASAAQLSVSQNKATALVPWRMRRGGTLLVVAVLCGMSALHAVAQGKPIVGENTDFASSLNKADRVEWFRDQGFGLFIHWSVDSQLGVTISHSLVGASQDYTERFFSELPKTFDPVRFDPAEWARLARLAGVGMSCSRQSIIPVLGCMRPSRRRSM